MKKFLISLGLGLALSAHAVNLSVTTSLTNGQVTTLLSSSALVTGVIITGTSSNAPVVTFYDCPSTTLTYVNPAYSNITSYATNYVTSYTNYFNVLNQFTNSALVDITNTVAASTNNYQIRLAASAPASNSIAIPALNYFFVNGVTVSNTVGPSTVTVSYRQ